jgi:putative ABC transport system permease protein
MFRNYLKIAIRSFVSQKYYSLINTVGLALGTATCILIVLFVQDELSYEKVYSNNAAIYRLVEDFPMGSHLSQSATVPFPTKATMMQDYPQIKNAALIFRPSSWGGSPVMKRGDNEFYEDNFIFAEHSFLEIYKFNFIKGDSGKALRGPGELVLTESTAIKYFGDEDPIGKTLTAPGFGDLSIVGVVEDLPGNTHLQFDMMCSFETFRGFFAGNPTFFDTQWTWVAAWMYFTVDDEAEAEKINKDLPAYVKRHYPAALSDTGLSLHMQKANDVHLTSNLELEFESNGNIQHVYLFSFIAILILIIAIINFMNLATSRSVKRAKEVGLRKVMGAHRQMLIAQFMGEAILTSFLALIIAVAIIYTALPWFNNLTGKNIVVDLLHNAPLLGGMLLLGAVVGVLAGSYPAFILSSFQPTEVLKGKSGNMSSNNVLRKVLVVSQFVISISMIICIGIVYQQLNYIHNKDMGFNKDQIVMIDASINGFIQKYGAYKSELLNKSEVESVTLLGGSIPGAEEVIENSFAAEGASEADQQQWFSVMNVNHDFEKVLNVEFLQGHSFQLGSSTDSSGYIINESTAKALGWEGDVIGKVINQSANGRVNNTGTVIGLVKDFNYRPLYEPIKPLVISLNPFGGAALAVKVKSDDLQATVLALENEWKKQFTGNPFRYSFMNENFDNLYRKEDKFSTTIQYFSGLAIFIACLGLLGLSAYTTEGRRKEIGIRKVNGATTFGLVTLLTKDFSLLILIAFGLSVPLAYYFSTLWLDNFAYKTEIGVFIFVLAGIISFALAIATVSYHTFKAARTNPVDSLRSE